MKNKFKFLAAILATLMLVSFIPLAAFAEEIETEAENTETDTAEPIEESSSESVEATSEGEISSDTENEETETMVFEFIEEEAPTIKPRIVDPGMEDFDPTDPVPDYIKIVSATVPDGVYSLQNIGNTGLWMDIEQSKTDAGYHVQQYAYSDNPAGTLFDRAGLFKISRKSNGLYVIRLMLNNRLSFGFVGNEVITKEIEVVDANVPDTDCFTITYISGSYIIKPYNSSYAISAKNTTASGLSGAPDSYLAKRTAADAGDRAKWQLFKYNRTDRSGSTIYFPSSWKNKGIPVGATGTMHNVTWSTYIGANTPKMRVASGYEDLMSYAWNETNLKTSFTALSVGNVKIQSQIFVGNTDTVKYTGTFSYFQVIPQEGTYLIRNEKTEKYIDVKGPNTNEGTLIHQWTYGESSSRRWIVEHVSGGEGFVRIKSAYSNKYLAVDSTTNTTIKQTSTLSNYSLWKFERTSAGNLMLVCKALPTTTVLALPSNSDYNGTNLTTVTYTNDETLNDEWQIFEDVQFQDLALDIDDTVSVEIQSYGLTGDVNVTDYSYTITSGSEYILERNSSGRITGLKSGTATVRATHKELAIYYTFEVKVNKNAIIIVPGMLGSELFVGSDNPYFREDMPLFSKEIVNGLSTYQDGDTVQDLIPSAWWEYVTNIPSAMRLLNAWGDSISCNEYGTSKYNVYVKEYRSDDPVTRTNNNCGTGNAYLNLYNKLVEKYSDQYSIDLFSYDWRLSNSISASKLDAYIENYHYDKVILIAHSMGGLVSSGYLGLGEPQREKVKQVFYLSSPLLGFPTVANIWYNEDISFVESSISGSFGISLENFNYIYKTITKISDPIQNLICNYASVYELLPSEYYFQLSRSSYMSNSFTTIMIGGQTTVTECSTYFATKEVLTGYFQDFNDRLMDQAEDFHDSTFVSGNHVSSYVDSNYYHCLNSSNSTISHVKFYQVVSSESYAAGLEVDGTTNNGDGFVFANSSTLANSYPERCRGFAGNHMTLVVSVDVIDEWIKSIK